MARWRLVAPHYLNVPGTEWEYKEIDKESGKQTRVNYKVPLYLDPNNPGDQTPRGSGDVIVCYEGKGQPRDHVFVGEPTPDMEPLDDEAKAISEALAPKWQHPIDNLPAGGFSDALLQSLEQQLTNAMKNATHNISPATTGVSADEFRALQEQVAQLMARNAELESKAQRRL